MLARFVCVLACVALTHCLPTRQPTEELVVRITNEELLKELASLEREYEEINSEKTIDFKENYTEDKTRDNAVTAEDEKFEIVTGKEVIEKNTNEDEIKVNSRAKRDVKDRLDIETIVTVKNNEIGTEKKYYFKTINRDVKGEMYRCKIGLTSEDVIFYYRCLLVSNGITGEGLQETGQGDFFDIA